jgi:hypothetical protein
LCFALGRDHDGHWVVQEEHGLCGGVFTSENAATRYAEFESAGRGSIIHIIPDPIELNCSSWEPALRSLRRLGTALCQMPQTASLFSRLDPGKSFAGSKWSRGEQQKAWK